MPSNTLTELQTGRIKWYRIDKNFGFLLADSGDEIFVHHSDLIYTGLGNCEHQRGFCGRALALLPDEQQAELRERFTTRRLQQLLEGARVKFRVVQTVKGFEARSVRRA